MQETSLWVMERRLSALEDRVRRYQRLTLALGLVLVLGVSMAARSVSSGADVLQARRLEVVDDVGNVRVSAYATAVGGRLEVRDNAGRVVFSAGAVQGAPEPVGLWEQTLQTIDRQGRDLVQQRRMLDDLRRQLQSLDPARQSAPDREPHSRDLTQLRFDLEQQRRALAAVDRQIQYLTSQVRSLERR